MKITGYLFVAALFLTPSAAFCGRWSDLFADLVNPNPEISGRARELAFTKLIPELQTEDQASLDRDLAEIAGQASSIDVRIHLQASALLASLMASRPDGDRAFSRIIPLMIGQLRDSEPRIRFNAAYALSQIKPTIPAEATLPLIDALKDADPRIVRGAAYGVARLARSSPDAAKALAETLMQVQGSDTRVAIVRAIGEAKVSDRETVSRLARLVGGNDRDLVKESLLALRQIGPAAVKMAHADIQVVAGNSGDPELAQLAGAALATETP